jgi:acetoin utilization protein AcuB
MLVREVMTPDPVTVTPGTSVAEVRRLLGLHMFRHLPVVDGGRLVGIVSDRDVLVGDPRLTASLQALHSDLLHGRYRRASELQHAPVVTAAPDEELAVAAGRLRELRIGALPVVEDGRLVGILTTADCLRTIERPAPATAAVEVHV